MSPRVRCAQVLLSSFLLAGGASAAPEAPGGPADAQVDLGTEGGLAAIGGVWRHHPVEIVPVDFRSPGPDRKPSGPPNRTYDIAPHAGGRDFDDASWEVMPPTGLADRRATGRLCFHWYRIRIRVPERIGEFDPAGSTLVFETVVDDYAEVWVDGELPRELGQRGGALVAGWNAPNRLVVGRDVRPGQEIQLAIFGINAPLSDPPANYVWMRSARLDFYRLPRAITARRVPVTVDRLDPALDAILPESPVLEQVAEGFTFIEGPVWMPGGYLLFSDPNQNRIYRWDPRGELQVFREQSGYQGANVAAYKQPGSNGLALDRQGRLTVDEHGNRRVTRLESNGELTVLAERYGGKRLNSPNDLIYRSDGALYFTDPPFGLPKVYEDPAKELPYSGVYRLANGELTLLTKELAGPNGIAFSPDEHYLYVGNWDPKRKVVMRYPVDAQGGIGEGAVFCDLGAVAGEEAIDGVDVDARGNVYVSGPAGLWIYSPAGKALGTVRGPELAANFAFGDADGRTLYLAARTGLYRLRLAVEGVQFARAADQPISAR